MSVHIIGCGGVGSYLIPVVRKLLPGTTTHLWDGDKLEAKNLDRQLFSEHQIGFNKAKALAPIYGCMAEPQFYAVGVVDHAVNDWIIGCVDNNAARQNILTMVDLHKCRAIIAANEKTSAEAYLYNAQWRGSPLDPRVYYPEITKPDGLDPMRPCTGEAQVETPQLVTANIMAAALAAHLLMIWEIEAHKLDAETIPHLPYMLVSNLTKLETYRIKDAKQTEKEK